MAIAVFTYRFQTSNTDPNWRVTDGPLRFVKESLRPEVNAKVSEQLIADDRALVASGKEGLLSRENLWIWVNRTDSGEWRALVFSGNGVDTMGGDPTFNMQRHLDAQRMSGDALLYDRRGDVVKAILGDAAQTAAVEAASKASSNQSSGGQSSVQPEGMSKAAMIGYGALALLAVGGLAMLFTGHSKSSAYSENKSRRRRH